MTFDLEQWRRELEEWRSKQRKPEPRQPYPYGQRFPFEPIPPTQAPPRALISPPPTRAPVPPDWLEPQELPPEAEPSDWKDILKRITAKTAQFGEWMRPKELRPEKPIQFPDMPSEGMDLGEGLRLLPTGEVMSEAVSFPVGNLDPETGEFSKSWQVQGISLLEKPLKALETAFIPVSFVGAGIGYLGEELEKRSKMTDKEWRAYKEAGLPVAKPEDIKKFLPDGEYYERLQETPFWSRLVLELPFWAGLAKGGVTALRAIKALDTAAAKGTIPKQMATAGKAILEATTIPTVERVAGVALRYGIEIPLRYAGAKAFQAALDTGLDRWIATQGRLKGAPAQSKLAQLIIGDREWLIERATQNLLKRQGRAKVASPTIINQAVDDTVRDAEGRLLPKLLEAAPEVPVRPTKPPVPIRALEVAPLRPPIARPPEIVIPKAPIAPEVTALVKKPIVGIKQEIPTRPMSEMERFLLQEQETARFVKELPIGKTFKYVDESTFEIQEGKILGITESREGETLIRIKPLVGKEFTVSPEYLAGTYGVSIEEQVTKLIERTKHSIRVAKGEGIYKDYADKTLQAKYEAELMKLEAIPKAEAGFPEAGLQPSMIEEIAAREVRPVGRGRVTQISMEDQLKLEQARALEAYEAQAEMEGLKYTLETDPVAQWSTEMTATRKTKQPDGSYKLTQSKRNVGLDFFISIKEGSFPSYFTVKQAELIAPYPVGRWSKYTQKGLPTYNKVPRDEVLDELAEKWGVSIDELAERVEAIRLEKARIKKLEIRAVPEAIPPEPIVEPVTPEVIKPAEPLIKPTAPEVPRAEAVTLTEAQVLLVQRKEEITKLLATPIKELPKGTRKIALRNELAEVKAKLIPAEKKLRQQIMAGVKTQGLGIRQKEALFKRIGGSRHLSEIPIEKLPAVLEAVRGARPVRIGQRKVITPKTETLIQGMKQEALDKGFLTQEGYEEILRGLKFKADKYTNANDFITETNGTAIIREIRNRLILGPLGELKFGTPTVLSALTSDVYYAQVLGLHPIVNELITGKVNSDLATRAMGRAVHKKLNQANIAWGVSQIEKAQDKIAGRPSRASVELRNLLDKYEELPTEVTKSLTPTQIGIFDWFRNLNRTIIGAENAVRRTLEMPEIPYREAYVRHVPDEMAREIMEGLHPLPPSLEYWSRRLVSKRIFNPTELHRQLSSDLEALYTRDLERATMDMVRIGMKEIHLNQPLKAFNERMSALTDKMPAATQEWVRNFINIRIKGQPSNLDASIDRLVTDSGIGRAINDVLRPYRLSLGRAPVTKMTELFGRGVMVAVLALPRPMLARLIIRNLFQGIQNLGLHSPVSLAKGYLTPVLLDAGNPALQTLKSLKAESPFLRAYTGLEELPSDIMSKVEKVALAPYQLSGVFNAYRAFDVAYWDYLPFITKPKYKGWGWADPQRTYTEAEGFLYPSEFKALMAEGELAARATQYEYIGVGMPAIFRNRTLIPLTRLQSWWMNHIFMFNREAAHRFLTGTTRLGRRLPWTRRINYLTYLLVGGAILTGMGYTSSYLWKTLPHNLSPVAQFMSGLWSYATATYDWQKERAKRDIFGSWKAMVPGALTFDEFQKLWTGELPLWRIFFYGTEEEGPPLHIPTWGIINRAPAESREKAIRDIEAATVLLGTEQTVDLPEPAYQINLQTGEWEKITERTYTYRMEDLRQAIRTATLKQEDKDITEENGFPPIAVLFKETQPFIDGYYRLPANQRQAFLLQDTPESIWTGAYLVLWGRLSYSGWVQDNPKTLGAIEQLLRQYNIPRAAIYGLKTAAELETERKAYEEEALRRAEQRNLEEAAKVKMRDFLSRQK